ncbi:MAG: NAD(P)/FAD-dependent oxidoreductase [Nitrospiraceae bacterium]|nr:MAG: NAD(P)/FAD-dependent oxidoreductase [Nitrospiraceae bacterium]
MQYVIIGNGVAGTTAALNIRKFDTEGKIIILSDESYPFYSRIRLPEYLGKTLDEKDLIIRKDTWYEENRIDLIVDTPVTDIDITEKKVIASGKPAVKYDRLLIATGGISFVPPIPGAGKKGVFTLRTLKDAMEIKEYAKRSNNRVVLIGGGVLGLEAGNGLRLSGNFISVVEFFPRLLPRQMDTAGAEILKTALEKMGFKFYLGVQSKEITGSEKVEALILDNGTRIDCDMILISAGVRHNSILARKLDLPIEKGVIVNDRMETAIPDVYAAGDLIQHNGIFYGIWLAAEKQGEVAGINMAGGNAEYQGTTISNTLKVAGIDICAVGDIDVEGQKEAIVFKDADNSIYKKLVIQNNSIIGTILCGDIRDRQKIIKAIESGKDIGPIKKELELWNMESL